MRNPFRFGKEVTGYQFYDREAITKELYRKLADGSSNVVLFAPRRYGKTSLVVRVLEELSVKEGIKGMCFDMTRVTSLARFCETYVNAVYAMVGGRRERMHVLTKAASSWFPGSGTPGSSWAGPNATESCPPPRTSRTTCRNWRPRCSRRSFRRGR